MGSTERLARLGRRSDADLAEAALCVCASVEDVDVDAWLLRIDALADALRTSGSLTGVPAADAVALGEFLGGLHGFRGNTDDYYDPANALLTQVLERRVGIPITTFMLTEDPTLVDFVDELTRTNRGRAYFASPDKVGDAVFVDYVRNRRRKR